MWPLLAMFYELWVTQSIIVPNNNFSSVCSGSFREAAAPSLSLILQLFLPSVGEIQAGMSELPVAPKASVRRSDGDFMERKFLVKIGQGKGQ